MTEYIQINLIDIIENKGEPFAKEILSSFLCPQNIDIEDFLKKKAIVMAKQTFSKYMQNPLPNRSGHFLYSESNIFLHFGISEANESEETSCPKISNSINDCKYDAKNT